MTFNLGKKGTRTTVGAPGTGMSYSDYQKYDGANDAGTQDGRPQEGSKSINLWPILFAIACIAYTYYTQTR